MIGFAVALLFLAAAVAVLVIPQGTLIAGVESGDVITNSMYLLIAVLLAASLAHRYSGRFTAALRDLAIWVVIFAGILVAYTFRDQLTPIVERVRAEIEPGAVITTKPGTAEVVRRSDGHFVVNARVNGPKLQLVFDTGASTVVLRTEDARRIGIEVDRLSFTTVIRTANGTARAADTTIDMLDVGTIRQVRVPALVARQGTLDQSLLGQSFLQRLSSYSVEGNKLILRSGG